MVRFVFNLSLFFVVAFGLAGCLDHHEWHQKLTVIVDTPNGEIKGSAVAKVNAAFGQLPMSSNEVNYEVAGEATIVDLGKGRYLFATIDEETKERFYRSDRNRFKGLRRGEWLYEIPKQKDVLTVPPKRYPMLVTFSDVNNPASVKLVDPNDLAATFGAGYALKSITLEITDEPVTTGKVESVLGWLGDPKVMENPGWKTLPINSRRAIGGLLSYFPKLTRK